MEDGPTLTNFVVPFLNRFRRSSCSQPSSVTQLVYILGIYVVYIYIIYIYIRQETYVAPPLQFSCMFIRLKIAWLHFVSLINHWHGRGQVVCLSDLSWRLRCVTSVDLHWDTTGGHVWRTTFWVILFIGTPSKWGRCYSSSVFFEYKLNPTTPKYLRR